MQGNVGGDAADQAVSYGVRERHEDDGHERGDSFPQILPVNFDDRFHHHDADEDERGADGPWRDRCQKRCEKQGEEEVEGNGDCRDARAAALADTRGGFDKRGDRRRPERGADDNGRRIAHERKVLAWEVAFNIHKACEFRHWEERAGRVEDVNVQERDERHPQLACPKLAKAQHSRRLLDFVHAYHVLEVLVWGFSCVRVRKIRHLQW